MLTSASKKYQLYLKRFCQFDDLVYPGGHDDAASGHDDGVRGGLEQGHSLGQGSRATFVLNQLVYYHMMIERKRGREMEETETNKKK